MVRGIMVLLVAHLMIGVDAWVILSVWPYMEAFGHYSVNIILGVGNLAFAGLVWINSQDTPFFIGLAIVSFICFIIAALAYCYGPRVEQ